MLAELHRTAAPPHRVLTTPLCSFCSVLWKRKFVNTLEKTDFCPTRCAYCSFVSASVEKSFGLMEPYLASLEQEITDAARMVAETGLRIKSFYMGGGTPTTLSAQQMDRLLTHLNRSFDLSGCVEYCIEAGRPDTITRDKLQVLLDHGADRISVNPQSLEDTVLQAIGLTAADAHKSENGTRYYTADKLNKAMSDALTANATTVKNALEIAVRNGGKAMPETDENGHSKVGGLEQGLYLVVETRVPENVTSTCNPFFVSLPMTTIDGKDWNYDVTVYPKNQTGSPDLEKAVREDKNSTGKNTGSLTDIADGYAHTATASVGDVVDYQIISTLPTITSKATSLTTYTFVDTLSKGICYNKNDVVIEFFRDAECTDKITTWDEDSGKFAVSYDDAANTMSIGMTEAGLADINESESVYTDSVKRGYSDCTMRITYAATLTADAKLGDTDNPNEVVLTWKRTNTSYYDTLQDCCHLYTYGVDVLKQFSDGKGDLTNVSFLLHNDTDDVYIIAEQRNGMYYVKGFTDKKADATTLVPNDSGHIIVNGLEDDTYTLTEIATDKGYVLLKDGVEIVIAAAESENACETCGVKLLTASGSVNGDAVDLESGNAIVPLTVINNPGFDLPKTGGYGTWMFTVGGCMLLGVAAFIVVRGRKHNRNDQ